MKNTDDLINEQLDETSKRFISLTGITEEIARETDGRQYNRAEEEALNDVINAASCILTSLSEFSKDRELETFNYLQFYFNTSIIEIKG